MLCELIIELGYISIRLSQLHVKDLEQFTPIILKLPLTLLTVLLRW